MIILLFFTFLLLLLQLVSEVWTHDISLTYLTETPRQLILFNNSPHALMVPASSHPVLYRSTNHGKEWQPIQEIADVLRTNRIDNVILHPYHNSIAYVIGSGTRHLITTDFGQSWRQFDTPIPPLPNYSNTVQFHANNPDHVIFIGVNCKPNCVQDAYITVNAFQSTQLLLSRIWQCKFAHSTPEFQLAEDKLIFCIETKFKSPPKGQFDFHFVSSIDYFKQDKTSINFNGAITSDYGVFGFSVLQKFITVAVIPPKRNADLDLYVSLDGTNWALAKFPMDSSLRENGYTMLDSLSYSLSIDVLTGTNTGTIYTSNSNGTYFRPSLNNSRRSSSGITDFERIEWQSGVILANQYIPETGDIITKISWDEGGHWHYLNPPDKDINGRPWSCNSGVSSNCKLHLHSITSNLNIIGKLYSEKSSPGIITGIGNVGTHLIDKSQCSLFISTDGGVTWRQILDGPHHYRQLDSGSVLVAADMGQYINELLYSINAGESWNQLVLPHTIKVQALMTDPDSLSSTLLVLGLVHDKTDKNNQFSLMHMDFSTIFTRRCDDNDYETWQLHVEGECVMGHISKYKRGKMGTNCLIGATNVPMVVTEKCPCEDDDFECDLNYEPNENGQCILAKNAIDPLLPKNCHDTYMGSSGWRKIPGNMCEGGLAKDTLIKRTCAASGLVSMHSRNFPSTIDNSIILQPRIIIIRSHQGDIYRSTDGGNNWKEGYKDIAMLTQHEHIPERLFMVDTSGKVFYSIDGGESYEPMNIPTPPNPLNVRLFDFHPEKPDWIIYMGAEDCPSSPNCRTIAYVTQNFGKSWIELDQYVDKCLFSRDVEFKNVRQDMIYCLSFDRKQGSMSSGDFHIDNPRALVAFTDFSSKSRVKLLRNVFDFFVDHGFLLAAEINVDKLAVKVSNDGIKFNEIEFPPDVSLDKRAFTVLSSSPARAFIDVIQSGIMGHEMGMLFTSDSSGLEFSVSLPNTNRDGPGGAIVDFTRPLGTRSIAIANKVINADAVHSGRAISKMIQSFITHNDGGQWSRLSSSECDDRCFVQLFNAASFSFNPIVSTRNAGGIIIGIGVSGNDETYLLPTPESSDTFLTIDGGHIWSKIAIGPHRSAILDRGGIIILVRAFGTISSFKWSMDYGETWKEQDLPIQFQQSASIMADEDGKQTVAYIYGNDHTGTKVVALDFSQSAPPCKPDDIGSWTLSGPNGQMCSLGERIHHPRRKKEVQCIIGSLEVKITKDVCDCDLNDYECDVGFWRNEAGKCVLKGPDPLKPPNCPDGTEYDSRSGYRKISASACKGGIHIPRNIKRVCGREDDPAPDIFFSKQIELSSPITSHLYTSDNSILILDAAGRVHYSADEGRDWVTVESEGLAIFLHPLKSDVYLAKFNQLLRSNDGGKSFPLRTHFPGELAAGVVPLSVHPEEPSWLLFNGRACLPNNGPCGDVSSFFTKDGGINWHPLLSRVNRCSWARSDDFNLVSRNGIFCIVGDTILYSDDYFFNDKTKVLSNVVDVGMEGEYFIGMTSTSNTKLNLMITRDMESFSTAEFPSNVDSLNEGYTALPNHRGSLLINVGLNKIPGKEYGRLFKSNSNGTQFSIVHDNTHQNGRGFVDYERIQGIPGLAILNTIANVPEVLNRGANKKLQSVMTYDDGTTWSLLSPPERDAHGHDIPCIKDRKDMKSCSLHLHSYTERRDPQNVFDSTSAPGLFVGIGNVGDQLDEYNKGNVYLTRDAGRTWHEVEKGAYQYEFGDHGGIIVLVNDEEPVSEIKYSMDDGKSFRSFRVVAQPDQVDVPPITQSEVRFKFITTRPDGTSTKFLLFGTRVDDNKDVMHFIDLTTLGVRKCNFDINNPDLSDFEPWSLDDKKCFFGKRIVYYRRKEGRDCVFGTRRETTLVDEKRCSCTRDDFECAFQFIRNETGDCVPINSQSPPRDNTTGYFISGYVKHPLSECVGGLELDKPQSHNYFGTGGMSVGGWIALILGLGSAVGLGYLAFNYKRQGGDFEDLLPTDIPTVRMMIDSIINTYHRLTRRFRYSRLRTQHHGMSSTSLLEEE